MPWSASQSMILSTSCMPMRRSIGVPSRCSTRVGRPLDAVPGGGGRAGLDVGPEDRQGGMGGEGVAQAERGLAPRGAIEDGVEARPAESGGAVGALDLLHRRFPPVEGQQKRNRAKIGQRSGGQAGQDLLRPGKVLQDACEGGSAMRLRWSWRRFWRQRDPRGRSSARISTSRAACTLFFLA